MHSTTIAPVLHHIHMPWSVKKSGNRWAIINSRTRKVVGHSATRAKAEASVRARYANYKEQVQK